MALPFAGFALCIVGDKAARLGATGSLMVMVNPLTLLLVTLMLARLPDGFDAFCAPKPRLSIQACRM
jgi:hypothetical protein